MPQIQICWKNNGSHNLQWIVPNWPKNMVVMFFERWCYQRLHGMKDWKCLWYISLVCKLHTWKGKSNEFMLIHIPVCPPLHLWSLFLGAFSLLFLNILSLIKIQKQKRVRSVLIKNGKPCKVWVPKPGLSLKKSTIIVFLLFAIIF